MLYQQFTDLIIWQESIQLYVAISHYVEDESFKKYFFKDQILRATLSISNNIAEGFERETTKELIRFLTIAKGSCGEVRSMLHLAQHTGYLDQKVALGLEGEAKKIGTLIGRYIRSIKRNQSTTAK